MTMPTQGRVQVGRLLAAVIELVYTSYPQITILSGP